MLFGCLQKWILEQVYKTCKTIKLQSNLMQVKLVEIDMLTLCEGTLSFSQAQAEFLIPHTLSWSSVDRRRHVTVSKTISYYP